MIVEAVGPLPSALSPGLILILGAVLVPVLRGWIRATWMLLLPVAAFLYTSTGSTASSRSSTSS